MPYKKKPTKKTYKKRKQMIVRRPYRLPVIGGFKNGQTVRLRYVCTKTLGAPTSGTISFTQFRANGLYDPDYTGTGHQPHWYDTWASVYDHYVVKKSYITCIFTNRNDSATAGNVFCGVQVTDFSNSIAGGGSDGDITKLVESGTRYKPLGIAGGSDSTKTIKAVFDAKRMFKFTNAQDERGLIGANFGSDPTETAFFNVWAGTSASGTVANYISVLVIIDYVCTLSEKRENTSQS